MTLHLLLQSARSLRPARGLAALLDLLEDRP
jgi:hypothetical protein